MNLDVSIVSAILAGVISFLSPCVLPLVPPYLCYISGVSLEDLTSAEHADKRKHRSTVLLTAFVFILGFSTVFTLLGATASAAGQVLRENLPLLAKIAGAAIIVMGLNFLGLFKLSFLSREARYHSQGPSIGLWGAYLIGLAFAFGWTPCIGPVLAAILSVAGSSDSVSRGFLLLSAYSVGLGIPFMLAAFSVDSFLGFFRKFRSYMPLVEKVMGLALIATGILFLTGGMQNLSYWLLEVFPSLASIG